MKTRNVAIIGGGISGLLCAYYLKKNGIAAQIFESSDRLGGWIRSEIQMDCILEWGPHTLLADEDWKNLIEDLNIPTLPLKRSAQDRFIYRDGRLVKLPEGLLQFFFSDILTVKGRLLLLSKVLTTRRELPEDETIREFFTPFIGKEAMNTLVDPFVRGIFAGSAHELSAAATFSELFQRVKSKSSFWKALRAPPRRAKRKSVGFKGGMEQVARILEMNLSLPARRNCKILGIEETQDRQILVSTSQGKECYSDVVVCTPAFVAADLLKTFLSDSSGKFLREGIPYQQVGLWNLIFKRESMMRSGFGMLVPTHEVYPIAASLWASEIFEGKCDPHKFVASQFFIGSQIPKNATENIFNETLGSLKRLIGIKGEPIYSEYRTYSNAIPQPQVGHAKNLQEVLKNLPKEILLCGNYFYGPGLKDVLQKAKGIASQITRSP